MPDFEPVENPEQFYRDADLVGYYQQALDALAKDDDKGRAEATERLIAAKRAAALTAAMSEVAE